MQEKQDKIGLIWFKNNLRIEDNEPLAKATQKYDKLIAVFCFEPLWWKETTWGTTKINSYRIHFLWQSINKLKENLNLLNIPLLSSTKSSLELVSNLLENYDIEAIFTQKEWTSEEMLIQQKIENKFPSIKIYEYYSQLVFHPNDLPFTAANTPDTFTNFRKKVEKYGKLQSSISKPKTASLAFFNQVEKSIPKLELKDLGIAPFSIDKRTAFPFNGGENSAKNRVQNYFYETKNILVYKETRNGTVGSEYSSKFSPWLANGSLSARWLYTEIEKFEKEVKSNASTYWLKFELLWREFFKYISLKHGNKLFYLHGYNENYYQHDIFFTESFEDWKNGKTGEEFVDANMLELNETGFMSNRGRQIVASYWCHDLKQDWRAGAAYFEQQLIDYDVHSNWGNWAYIAGIGSDPRPNRYFNTEKQAERYDGDRQFRDLWKKRKQ